MKKVIFCGTHPSQYNGYSKVVFELARYLSKCENIKLHIFGFQNFYDKDEHKLERKLPHNVDVFDVYANENPKNKGFGEKLIKQYIEDISPDIVIIYNDLVVINSLLEVIKTIENRNFKIVPYIDIVYKNEKNMLIKNISDVCDSAIMFTKYWDEAIKSQDFAKPTYILEHGFNKDSFYPIPKSLSRRFFGISEEDFVIVNLNRNQPRKRWDLCMMSFIKFVSTHRDENIKLLIATGMNGGWDLIDLIISECRKYKMDLNEFKKHLIIIQNPQQISDFEINVMYNVGDIGINTCDGEGFGLCNFEQAGVGVPQIVPNIGGFKDFFNLDNSCIIDPKWTYYCDHSRDFVAGEAEVCDVDDYVKALEYYYNNKEIVQKHGKAARSNILKNYDWDDKGKTLYDIIAKETNIQLDTNEHTLEIINGEGDQTVEDDDDDDDDDEDIDLDKLSSKDMKILLKKLLKK